MPTNIWLRNYTGEGLVIKRSTAVTVQYSGQLVEDLHFLVIESDSPSLMGCNYLM
jgi:hypothetical protein